MNIKFVDIFILITIFQLLVLSLFLFCHKKGRRTSHRILGLFFLALAINLFHALCLRLSDYFVTHYPHVFYIGAPFAFLIAPCMYLYLKSLIYKNFKFRKLDIIHLLLFLIYFTYLLFTFYFQSADIKRELLIQGFVITRHQQNIIVAILQIQTLFYVICAFGLFHTYRSEIRNYYSSIEKINYSWIKFIIISLIIIWLQDVGRFITYLQTDQFTNIFTVTLFSSLLVFCYLILYKALIQPEVFSGISEKTKQMKQSLSETTSDQYLQKLVDHMNNKKPYLNPALTLMDLAEEVSIPPRSLSEVIHSSLNQNFYDFINTYRIKESKRLLSTSSEQSKTVLEILYKVGFNNKSSFNNAFKKITGKTPSQFRKLKSNLSGMSASSLN